MPTTGLSSPVALGMPIELLKQIAEQLEVEVVEPRSSTGWPLPPMTSTSWSWPRRPGNPGIPGHEPDLSTAREHAEAIDKAMNEVRKRQVNYSMPFITAG